HGPVAYLTRTLALRSAISRPRYVHAGGCHARACRRCSQPHAIGVSTSATSEIAASTLMKEATLGSKIRMSTVLRSKPHAEREIAELASRSRRDFPKVVPRV